MKTTKILTLLLFIVFTLIAESKGKLTGIVKDSFNNPVQGADVTIIGTTCGAQTNENGQFYIIGINEGVYSVKVSYTGEKDIVYSEVRIESGKKNVKDIIFNTDHRIGNDKINRKFLKILSETTIDSLRARNEKIDTKSANRIDKEGFTPLLALFYPNYNYMKKWEPDSIFDKVQRFISISANVNIQNNYGVTPLMKACELGIINVVELFLKNKADIELKNYLDQTAIFYAVKSGNIKIVDLLLENEAKTKLKDKTGRKPIFYANSTEMIKLLKTKSDLNEEEKFMMTVIEGDTNAVKQCFKHKAKINFTFNDNKTALMYACKQGQTETVKLFLDKEIDLNAVDSSGNNPLIYSTLSNNPEIIQLLLNSGLPIDNKNKSNETALIVAVKKNRIHSVETLMKNNSDETVRDIYERTALDWAVINKHEALSEIIIKLSKNGIYKNNLIFWAIENELMFLVNQLLNNGVDINICNEKNQTPLYKAIVYKKFDIAYNLLRNGANPNLPPKIKTTVLMNAIKLTTGKVNIDPYDDDLRKMYNNLDDFNKVNHSNKQIEINIIDSLIKYGASINPDSSAGSPLTLAVETGNISLAQELVKKGADIKITDDKGNNILQILLEKNIENPNLFEILKYFESKGARLDWINKDGGNVFMTAASINNLEIVKYLFENIKILDLNNLDRFDRCALLYATQNKNYEMVKFLMEKHANVNISRNFKQKIDWMKSPLLKRAIESDDSTALLFLNNGIDFNEKFHNDETPLMYACKYQKFETIKKLLELGADPYEKDKNGKTAFDHARNNKEILDILNTYKKN